MRIEFLLPVIMDIINIHKNVHKSSNIGLGIMEAKREKETSEAHDTNPKVPVKVLTDLCLVYKHD